MSLAREYIKDAKKRLRELEQDLARAKEAEQLLASLDDMDNAIAADYRKKAEETIAALADVRAEYDELKASIDRLGGSASTRASGGGRRGKTKAAVIDALTANPDGLTTRELADMVGANPTTFAQQASNYIKQGLLVREGGRGGKLKLS